MKHSPKANILLSIPLNRLFLNFCNNASVLLFYRRAFVEASALKKRQQTVLDQLGGHSQKGSVYNVLGEA